MTRIELWGPPGSGKSTIINRMRKAGFDVRDAPEVFDEFGREVYLTSRKATTVKEWLLGEGIKAVRYSADKKTIIVTCSKETVRPSPADGVLRRDFH